MTAEGAVGALDSKRCGTCGKTKSLADFNRYEKNKVDGRQPRCRECQQKSNVAWREKNRERSRARAREWNRANPEAAAEHHYKARYGITWAQYDAMFTQQGGLCAICRRECPSGNRLAVDHDHSTGQVRALLCTPCNQGLGRFHDDMGLMERAIQYLADYRTAWALSLDSPAA